jgi:hypothetical protein
MPSFTFIASPGSFWKHRLQASCIHLTASLVVAVVAALLVFGLWYPYPYREISGGRELFLLVVAVDVIIGPLITFAVFDRAKPRHELRRDLAVVVLIQLTALGYGLWTVCMARPVHMVFEYDRFRVVHAVEVPQELLGQTPAGIVALPLTGPTLLALRPFKSGQEKMETTLAALQGLSLSSRPDLWQPYTAATAEVLQAARPALDLKVRFASQASDIDSVLAEAGRSADSVVYLPLVGRNTFWTVFLDSTTAAVLATLPLDSF